MAKTTMMDQFHAIKANHPDTVLFFRMGDFYELFHDDAHIGGEALGLTVTSRDKNSENPIPMAGFPWHALESQLRKMLAKGHKVTVCEQEETLRPGAKLLERIVTRVYTPGSLYEESLIGTDATSTLASILCQADSTALAVLDASTGRVVAAEFTGDGRWARLLDEVLRSSPDEIVLTKREAEHELVGQLISQLDGVAVSQHHLPSKARLEALRQQLQLSDLGLLDLDRHPLAMEAAGLAVDYVSKLHVADSVPIRDVLIQEEGDGLVLDQTTLRNLEVAKTLIGEYEGSLLQSIDSTKTAMGRRMLKSWLMRPLRDIQQIKLRQDAIAHLIRASRRLRESREKLKGLRDLERLSMQLSYGRSNGRDLVAIAACLDRMPTLESLLKEGDDPLLNELVSGISALDNLRHEIQVSLKDEQPLAIKEGGMFREDTHAELDELRVGAIEGKAWITDFEEKERKRLEIPSLKVQSNRQIGWFIQVTKSHLSKVPEEYHRKQQMTNGNRYYTEELKRWEDIILNSDTRANDLEYQLFCELRDKARDVATKIAAIANQISQIDAIASLAEISRQRTWVRPEIVSGAERLELVGARHPVLESQGGFVPNDVNFNKKRKFLLMTGPNMGGKSTYLRTTALITILAQAGSFVPAEKAKISLADRIFTRVGASDDIRRGRSTFMMEMIEVAHIMRRASPSSLVLLDEVGRGTSTFDGLSIAWAMTEDIAKRISCRTLFATHYHQLVGLEDDIPTLVNIHVQIAEAGGRLKFLHTVADGPCDDSYGVHVAALAGIPADVIERARDLLAFLESQAEGAKAGESGSPIRREAGQKSLFGYLAGAGGATIQQAMTAELPPHEEKALNRLKQIDPDMLSPREAIDILYELRDVLQARHHLMRE
ncbi:MAG: DNA mismatch repair protein MutS [Euryarchaeota archaeon]|nr:DNA mismatch repair protein MutS [Euryarchaeota archaeon]